MDRDFMRQDMEHYMELLMDAIAKSARFAPSRGYTPLNGALASVIKWLRADSEGNHEIASEAAWFDSSDLAAQTWQEWWDIHSGIFTEPRERLEGLSVDEYGALIEPVMDEIMRATIAGELPDNVIVVEADVWQR